MAFLCLLALGGRHFCLLYRGFFSSSDPVETRLCQVSICQGENFNFSLSHTHTHTRVTVTLIPRRSWLPLIGQFQQSHELNFIDMDSERKFLSEFWNNYDTSLSGVLFSLPSADQAALEVPSHKQAVLGDTGHSFSCSVLHCYQWSHVQGPAFTPVSAEVRSQVQMWRGKAGTWA